MKAIFILLFMIAGAFAQVDSVYTQQKIFTGVIIGANRTTVCMSHYSYDRQWIPIKQVVRLVTGRDGKIIIGAEAPDNGYELFVEAFNEKFREKKRRRVIWMKSYESPKRRY